MTPDPRGADSPCEHYARIGYEHLAADIPAAEYERHPYPTDDDEDDRPGVQARWTDALVLRRLVGAEPPPLPPQVRRALGAHIRPDYAGPKWGKRDEQAAAEAPEPGAKEPPAALAGVTLSWHYALPELKIWAGRATLTTLIDGRRAALSAAVWPGGVRLLDWSIPYPTMSGLDPRTAATALDIGFSPAALDMPVACYAAAELLMYIGLQVSPVTRFGRREYGYTDADGRWWRYAVVEREGYHRMLTMASAVPGQYPAYSMI